MDQEFIDEIRQMISELPDTPITVTQYKDATVANLIKFLRGTRTSTIKHDGLEAASPIILRDAEEHFISLGFVGVNSAKIVSLMAHLYNNRELIAYSLEVLKECEEAHIIKQNLRKLDV